MGCGRSPIWLRIILFEPLKHPWERELMRMKNKRVKLTEKDLHIIDVYSKKNLSDTMPQFGNLNGKVPLQGITLMQNEK